MNVQNIDGMQQAQDEDARKNQGVCHLQEKEVLSGARWEAWFREIYDLYADNVYRLCFSYMKNVMDAEDVMQDTFVKYYRQMPSIQKKEEAKAWLLVAASNECKNLLKHWWRKHQDITDYAEIIGKEDEKRIELFDVLMRLPVKYKTVVYLYYYEGYNSRQISEMLGKPESTVRTHLKKAKEILKKSLSE